MRNYKEYLHMAVITHRGVDGCFKHVHSTCFECQTNCLTIDTTSSQHLITVMNTSDQRPTQNMTYCHIS